MGFQVCCIPFFSNLFHTKMLSVHDPPVRNPLCSSSSLFSSSMRSVSILPYNLLITLVTEIPLQLEQSFLLPFLFIDEMQATFHCCGVSSPISHLFITHVSIFISLSGPCFSISAYTPSDPHHFPFFSSLTAFLTLSSLNSTISPPICVGEIFFSFVLQLIFCKQVVVILHPSIGRYHL